VASVRLEHVKKVYAGNVVAVQSLDLEVKDHEFVVLVGPSGCGKSTTLRMIAGLEELTEGNIFIEDALVNDIPPKDRDIAMVFQNYALYPHMSVYENLAFGLKLRKFPKQEIEQRVREAASILGIQDLLDRKPKALSGGQRQRVAVGRAIVRKPKVFLFDEPLSNLDAKLRVQMRTEITKLHHRLDATMIYVTHDQTEAMTMADRIVLMKDGFVQQIDDPLGMYNRPVNKFVAGFVGSPSMNFFEGTIERDGALAFVEDGSKSSWQLPAQFDSRLIPFAGKRIVLGLRPEDVALDTHSAADHAKIAVKVLVEVVEPMGNEILLYFKTTPEGRQFIARIGTEYTPKVGSTLSMEFDLTKGHFFDAQTENHI
jgi:multiple sugar transport system ATP-binding protein